jgi:hypothetical protein
MSISSGGSARPTTDRPLERVTPHHTLIEHLICLQQKMPIEAENRFISRRAIAVHVRQAVSCHLLMAVRAHQLRSLAMSHHSGTATKIFLMLPPNYSRPDEQLPTKFHATCHNFYSFCLHWYCQKSQGALSCVEIKRSPDCSQPFMLWNQTTLPSLL